MTSTTQIDQLSEVAILARVLAMKMGLYLFPWLYLLNREFSDSDKARMHVLAVRNQEDALSADELEELDAYAKAGTMLSILKSRARRALGIKLQKRTPS